MRWELCKLSDGKWSVRRGGREFYILNLALDERGAQAIARMLNALEVEREYKECA